MKRIFIVEDNITLRTEIFRLLQSYGYTCEVSDDFEHIAAASIQAMPDLLLLDINLPYCYGFHVCREIRKTYNVPIIMLTSRSGDIEGIISEEVQRVIMRNRKKFCLKTLHHHCRKKTILLISLMYIYGLLKSSVSLRILSILIFAKVYCNEKDTQSSNKCRG